jgi:hypothetical protein
LGRLNHLDFLDLSNNQLTGPFPAWAHNLTKLALLNLGQNNISGDIPLFIGKGKKGGSRRLTNLGESLRLLSKPDASFKDSDGTVRAKFIRLLEKQYPYNILSKDLLWVAPGRYIQH